MSEHLRLVQPERPADPAGAAAWRQPAAEPERYVNRKELAGIMGVSVDTIDRMRHEGLPSVVWSKRTRRFLPSEAIRWARERGMIAA